MTLQQRYNEERKDERREIATTAISMGMDNETIKQLTKLSLREIEKLREEYVH